VAATRAGNAAVVPSGRLGRMEPPPPTRSDSNSPQPVDDAPTRIASQALLAVHVSSAGQTDTRPETGEQGGVATLAKNRVPIDLPHAWCRIAQRPTPGSQSKASDMGWTVTGDVVTIPK